MENTLTILTLTALVIVVFSNLAWFVHSAKAQRQIENLTDRIRSAEDSIFKESYVLKNEVHNNKMKAEQIRGKVTDLLVRLERIERSVK